MLRSLSFLKQYIRNPRTVGAVLPSSENLAHEMIEDIDFKHTNFIVEYGPGTGIFTEELLKHRNNDTIILLVENNRNFCCSLKDKFKAEENFYVICGSAEDVDKYMKKYNMPYADYVVSGLPFGSLPINVSRTILNKTKKVLRPDGKFITFQYTLLRKRLIADYFNHIDIELEPINMPPAFVFSCSNEAYAN